MDLDTLAPPPAEVAGTPTASPFAIGEVVPQTVYRPRDAAELARLLAECSGAGRAVVTWGGGTLQHLGNAPARYDAVLSTASLDGVVEYAADDLTVTVQAGMTLDAVDALLGAQGQFLPLDVPHPERATIGGTLATGMNGPLRLRYGPARDYMLGNRFAVVEGEVIRAGARVVKNVAGYELHKVMVGSFGTLAVLTEATFKVFPRPATETTVWASFGDLAGATTGVAALWQLATPPLALELFDAATASLVAPAASGAWHVAARFGGTAPVIAAARDYAAEVVSEQGGQMGDVTDGADLWRGISNLPATLGETDPDAVVLRLGLPPRALEAGIRALLEQGQAEHLPAPRIFAHAANAVIYASFSPEGASHAPASLGLALKSLRSRLEPLHAHVTVEDAPAALKSELDVWGEVGPTLRLMQSIKRKFDPNNILNPGRFVV